MRPKVACGQSHTNLNYYNLPSLERYHSSPRSVLFTRLFIIPNESMQLLKGT